MKNGTIKLRNAMRKKMYVYDGCIKARAEPCVDVQHV